MHNDVPYLSAVPGKSTKTRGRKINCEGEIWVIAGSCAGRDHHLEGRANVERGTVEVRAQALDLAGAWVWVFLLSQCGLGQVSSG